jgi:hypothetical protein
LRTKATEFEVISSSYKAVGISVQALKGVTIQSSSLNFLVLNFTQFYGSIRECEVFASLKPEEIRRGGWWGSERLHIYKHFPGFEGSQAVATRPSGIGSFEGGQSFRKWKR